jgi:hypothetical protein
MDSRDQVEQRSFARAIRTDQSQYFALDNLHRDEIDRHQSFEGFRDAFQL